MNITFIGLGKMGSAMVERLLLAGYRVTVFNRTVSKAEPLVKIGAYLAPTVADAVQQADVVMSCLLNDKAVLETTQEMIPYMKPLSIHVCISTVLPDTSVQLKSLHEASNTSFVSAVVLGVPKVVKRGESTTYCAGYVEHIAIILPLLRTFSNNATPLGDNIKAANTIKICLNYSLATTIELISELYVFAEKSGLDVEHVKTALHQIYGHPSFKLYVDKIQEQSFDEVNFTMAGGHKDIAIFQEAFARVGVVPELGNILRGRFISALAQGMDDKDWSGIYEVISRESGL
jgi:3-hydroxyisobutyrate dehydrogenase-like beta-hydroxyacid dehydrogenase